MNEAWRNRELTLQAAAELCERLPGTVVADRTGTPAIWNQVNERLEWQSDGFPVPCHKSLFKGWGIFTRDRRACPECAGLGWFPCDEPASSPSRIIRYAHVETPCHVCHGTGERPHVEVAPAVGTWAWAELQMKAKPGLVTSRKCTVCKGRFCRRFIDGGWHYVHIDVNENINGATRWNQDFSGGEDFEATDWRIEPQESEIPKPPQKVERDFVRCEIRLVQQWHCFTKYEMTDLWASDAAIMNGFLGYEFKGMEDWASDRLPRSLWVRAYRRDGCLHVHASTCLCGLCAWERATAVRFWRNGENV